MPYIHVEYDSDALDTALTALEAERPAQIVTLLRELIGTVKTGLIEIVDANEGDIAIQATPYPAIVGGRFPIEITIQTTYVKKQWGNQNDTDQIVDKILKLVKAVLKKWQNDSKANFGTWQISVAVIFLGAFGVSRPIKELTTE